MRGSNELPLEVSGGLKTQTLDFQLLTSSSGMKNKHRVLQLLNYPAKKRLKYRESIKFLGRIGTSVPWARVYRLSSLALMQNKYDVPVDLDEIFNRPPPEDDAIVKFALRIVL